MNRKFNIIKIIVLLFCAFQVNAQNTLDNLGLTNTTLSSAAYSFRLLSSGYSGPLARITIGTNYYDVYPDISSNKNLSLNSPISAAYTTYNAAPTGVTSNLLSSIVNSSVSATIAIWYDQSGNAKDAFQATTSSQPRIINSGLIDSNNGLPAMTFQNVSQVLEYSGSITVQTINTVRSAPNANWQTLLAIPANSDFSVRGANGSLYNISPNSNDWTYGTSPNQTWVNQNQAVAYTPITTHTAFISSLNPTTGTMSINSTFMERGMYGGAAVNEIVLFPSTLTTIERTTIETNQIDKYLIFLITSQLSSTNQSVVIGGTPTDLSITSGVTAVTFQWYSNTTNSNSGGTLLPGQTNSTYTPDTSVEGTKYYYVIVSNSTVSSVSNVSGYVRVGIEITSQPSSSSQIVFQGSATTPLNVLATGSNLTYQWYKNTVNNNSTGTLILGANTSTYTPSSADLGTLYYYVTILGTNTSLTSSVSGSIKINVRLPIITYNTTSQNFIVGTLISPLTVSNSGGEFASVGNVSTLAGSGSIGSVNGIGTSATFYYPTGIAIDANGTIYVADQYNKKIRKITSSGVVSTLAGSGNSGRIDGIGTFAMFSYPTGTAVDANGTVYVADQRNNKIRKITSSGVVSTFAGSGISGSIDGMGTAASFFYPTGIAIDAYGNIYVADQNNHKIRKITSSGFVTTIAGSGALGSTDGIGTSATFYYPVGIAVDTSGNVYVADQRNSMIRKITSSGVVTTIAGSGIRGNTDGIGTAASFSVPTGIAVDTSGTIYVADEYNNNIRKITSSGVVTTLAGNGTSGSTDGAGTAANFSAPTGITIDANGNLYVADQRSNKIRKISQSVFQISPNLPDGLTLNVDTGSITGTPTIATPATNYTITGSNTSGSSSTVLNITTTLLIAPSLSNFNNVTKSFYDISYTLTPPTSNSLGAFTYTSSDTNVATVNGNLVTFVGPGTTTITAIQAANGFYLSDSITATLTVTSTTVLTTNGAIANNNLNYVNKNGALTSATGLSTNGEIIATKTPYNALNFSSSLQNYATLPPATYFSGDFTIECWVYPTAHTNWSRVIDFGNGTSNNVLFATSSGGSGKPGLHISGSQFEANDQLVLNQWSHIAVTLSGTTATIYINGIASGTSTFPVPANVIRNDNYIGRSNWGWGDPAPDATFDDLRIWSVAKTDSQIVASMNKELSGTEAGLVAYFKFNDGIACGANSAITTLTNSASSGAIYNATLQGFTLNGGCTSNFVNGKITSELDGLTSGSAARSAFAIKQAFPSSTDGLYWITNPNINGGTPFQVYADMTTDGGGWTLLLCNNSNSGWDATNAILRNETNPTINGQYSIIAYADYLKKSASGFQYMIDAQTRGQWGGIWTANQAYSFVHTANDQTDITLNTKFSNWEYANNSIEAIMPWYAPGQPGAITTSTSPSGEWWGTLVSTAGYNPTPYMSNYNSEPGIIWYWVR